jgi:hypothetical protein
MSNKLTVTCTVVLEIKPWECDGEKGEGFNKAEVDAIDKALRRELESIEQDNELATFPMLPKKERPSPNEKWYETYHPIKVRSIDLKMYDGTKLVGR